MKAPRGFTILELTISLFVIALLLGSILIPLQTQVQERKTDESKRLLEQAQESLLGYVSANGYFPCPADGASNGQEAFGANHATGYCPVWQGFLPAAVLGFKPVDAQGYAIDAWGLTSNRIRYAVSNYTVAGITNPFTRTNGLRTIPISSFAAMPMLFICQSGSGVNPGVDCGTAVTLASNAAAVIWSVGANAATGGSSIHEAQNPNPNGGSADRIFVSRAHSNAALGEFDDILVWISATALLSRLMVAGQFTPAAQMAASPLP